MAEETIERKFNVTGMAVLRVGNISGLVDVQPGEEGVIAVTAVKHTGSGDADRTQVEITQAEDGECGVVAERAERCTSLDRIQFVVRSRRPRREPPEPVAGVFELAAPRPMDERAPAQAVLLGLRRREVAAPFACTLEQLGLTHT